MMYSKVGHSSDLGINNVLYDASLYYVSLINVLFQFCMSYLNFLLLDALESFSAYSDDSIDLVYVRGNIGTLRPSLWTNGLKLNTAR